MRYANGEVTFEGRAGAVRVFKDEVHLVIGEGPATVSYRGTTLGSETPAVRVIAKAELIIPLMPGDHAFEVRALEQPPVFRNWQAWDK